MITIVSGTNRNASFSKKISLFCRDILQKKGQEATIIDLADLPDDFIFKALYENTGKHPVFNPMRDHILACEKFLFVVPEYNGSFPGVLKAFIDGLKYPDSFKGKKCAMIGISSGVQGGALAMSHLTDIFNYMGMHVLANKPRLSGIENNMAEGTLTNHFYVQFLEKQADQLIAF